MTPEKTPIGYDLETAFKSSSLSRTILGIEIAEKAVPFISQTIPPPVIGLDLSKTSPEKPSEIIEGLLEKGILDIDINNLIFFVGETIKQSASFERTKPLIDSTAQYLSFLQSDAHISGKLFAASLPFQEYFKKSIRYARPGSCFQRMLEELVDGDEKKIEFISKAFDSLVDLDETYSFLRGSFSTQYTRNLNKAQQAQDSLLDIAFNTEDHSGVRRFVLEYPAQALGISGYIRNRGYKKDDSPYDPDFQVQRLKALTDIINPEDYSWLANYLQSSLPPLMALETAQILDKEIKAGNFNMVNTVVSFFQALYAESGNYDKIQIMGRNVLFKQWLPEFMKGKINEEQLLQLASNFQALRLALNSLPDSLRGDITGNGIGLEGNRSSEFYDVELLTTEPAFLTDGLIIARIVSAGISPAGYLIDEIKEKDGYLDPIVAFGQSLFDLPEDFISEDDKVKIIGHFLKGLKTEENLKQISNGLYTIQQVLEGVKAQGYPEEGIRKLKSWIIHDFIFGNALDSVTLYALLLPKGIYPTERIKAYIKEHGTTAIDKLEQLKSETARGNLNPKDRIQKDLEFFQYVCLTPIIIKPAFLLELEPETELETEYTSFSQLSFFEDEDNIISLDTKEEIEAEAAAYEAARLYWLVKERVDRGRNVIVIGNQRYGDLFVVQPLEKKLAELNISERKVAYVRSSGTGNQSIPQIFPEGAIDSFVRSLITKSPDVIIVDGTPNSFSGNTPRLPSSMTGYFNWFLAFNQASGNDNPNLPKPTEQLKNSKGFQDLVDFIRDMNPKQPYTISYWVPNPGNQIAIGNGLITNHVSPAFEEPEVILANPVIDPKHFPKFPPQLDTHQPGYFDDPETKGKIDEEIVLTKRGVRKLRRGKTTEELISLVQNRMAFVMEEMIRATNPLFLND